MNSKILHCYNLEITMHIPVMLTVPDRWQSQLSSIVRFFHANRCWNGLPLEVRLLPKNNEIVFYKLLKTDLYRHGWAGGASE